MLALALAALAVALMAPTQTLAQTHRSSCANTHAKTKCGAPACKQSSRKRKGHHAVKCATKHAGTKKNRKSISQPLAAAQCADGSAPVLTSKGSFACDDGSEPQCENGAIPTKRGNRLVCPVIFEEEESSSSEAECEEEGEEGTCAGASFGSGEQPATTSSSPANPPCEESAGEGSPSQCEAEG